MRSRPKVEVRCTPAHPRPGEKVRFDATLTGHSRTPIDRVCFHFVGRETRQSRGGESATLASFDWFDLYDETEAMVLEAGEQVRCSAEFRLPPKLPPTYSSAVSRIEYVLEVRCDIPWWPDLTERHHVRVRPPLPKASKRAAPDFDATPSDKGVQVQLSLAGGPHLIGGELEGAVAVENFGPKGVRWLELSLVAIDNAVETSEIGPKEIFRSRPVIVSSSTPQAGEVYPFRVRVPRDLPPTFQGRVVELLWFLEVRALVRKGRDAVLRSGIDILAADDSGPVPVVDPAPPRIAPLGRERRARAWATVAKKAGLRLDPESETMTGAVGPVWVTLQLEPHARGLSPLAQLEWPPLGLGLEVAERRWRDAFGGAIAMHDPAFDRRFAVRGRSAVQVQAVLDEPVRDALLEFPRIALDDESAELESDETDLTVEALIPVVERVWNAAKELSVAIARVPAPEPLGPHRAAWAAFAEKVNGQFLPGCFAIRADPRQLVTAFDADGRPHATIVRALAKVPRRPSAEAKKLMASMARELEGLRLAEDAVEARLPCPLPDPTRAESVWRALARVVKAL